MNFKFGLSDLELIFFDPVKFMIVVVKLIINTININQVSKGGETFQYVHSGRFTVGFRNVESHPVTYNCTLGFEPWACE